MVKIREFIATDFEEVVDMYHKMIIEVYPHREFKDRVYFYKVVMNWIDWKYDIMITEDSGVITGFSLCYMDSMGGICDDYYQAECVYIKDQYRKGRSAYLFYHTAMNFADSQGYLISTNASKLTESHSLSNKLGFEVFSKYERLPTKKQGEQNGK